jgi:uridine kinase
MAVPVLIGLAGASCSGKTTLAQHLATRLPGSVALLSLDSYYRDYASLSAAEQADFNFDAPAALDRDLLFAQLRQFAAGQGIEKSVYRFSDHARTAQGERVEPSDFAIVEGLFALYWEEMRPLYSLGVFIEVEDEVCLARRIERDQTERGRCRADILCQYNEQVRPMYQRYIQPTQTHADLVVSGLIAPENSANEIIRHLDL